MLLTRFFKIIDASFLGRIFSRKGELLEKINPERIYVENIRSFLGINTRWAKFICEVAVREKLFKRKYALECRNCNRILASFDTREIVPKKANCDICELNGEDSEFQVLDSDVTTYYELIKRS